MYYFYQREIQLAIDNEDYDRMDYLIKDAPHAVYEALVRNEIIEVSVDKSREEPVQLQLI